MNFKFKFNLTFCDLRLFHFFFYFLKNDATPKRVNIRVSHVYASPNFPKTGRKSDAGRSLPERSVVRLDGLPVAGDTVPGRDARGIERPRRSRPARSSGLHRQQRGRQRERQPSRVLRGGHRRQEGRGIRAQRAHAATELLPEVHQRLHRGAAGQAGYGEDGRDRSQRDREQEHVRRYSGLPRRVVLQRFRRRSDGGDPRRVHQLPYVDRRLDDLSATEASPFRLHRGERSQHAVQSLQVSIA